MTNTANNLANFDFQILIETSGSMGSDDAGKVGTRLQRAKESVIGLVGELPQIDEDGIDVIFFGGETVTHVPNVKSTADVDAAFNRRASGGTPTAFDRRTSGGTPTAEALAKAFEIAGKSDKPDAIIVITDGEPNNRQAVKDVIVKQANSQDTDEELTILFIQIGDDPSAASFLADLDDGLHAKFNIVDTMTQAKADSYPSLAALINDAIAG